MQKCGFTKASSDDRLRKIKTCFPYFSCFKIAVFVTCKLLSQLSPPELILQFLSNFKHDNDNSLSSYTGINKRHCNKHNFKLESHNWDFNRIFFFYFRNLNSLVVVLEQYFSCFYSKNPCNAPVPRINTSFLNCSDTSGQRSAGNIFFKYTGVLLSEEIRTVI